MTISDLEQQTSNRGLHIGVLGKYAYAAVPSQSNMVFDLKIQQRNNIKRSWNQSLQR